MARNPTKKRTKKPSRARSKSAVELRAQIMLDIQAENMTAQEIADKHKVSLPVVRNIEYQHKRAKLEAKLSAEVPGDSLGQLRMALKHACVCMGRFTRAEDLEAAARALKTVGEIVLVFDNKPSNIVSTESKTPLIDLSKLTRRQLEFLEGIELAAAGESEPELPLSYDPDRPQIYQPGGITFTPEPEPTS